MGIDIREVKDLVWSFGTKYPMVNVSYQEEADPTPCYPHDLKVVREMAEKAGAAFPMPASIGPVYFVLSFETMSRTNAWASKRADYSWRKDESKPDELQPWEGHIALLGKRTPIHVAVTRYVVPHEYGHILHYYIADKWKENADEDDSYDNVYKAYAKVRGIEIAPGYGPGTWHTSIGEIFANDFRIIMCKAEPEFWPHPHIAHPNDLPEVKKWWAKQRKLYGAY